MMARGITITAEAPAPWTNRKAISDPMPPASPQPTEPTMNKASPT